MSTAITATGEKPLTPADAARVVGAIELQGIVRAAGHYGVIVVVGALIWLVSSRYGFLWALPLIVVQGYFVAFLFMVVHETAHKTAFRSRALNLAFGHLSSFAIGLPYEYYCLFHWDHHRYTQDPERDPELLSVRSRPRTRNWRSSTAASAGRLPGAADASPCVDRQRHVTLDSGKQTPHCREGSAPLFAGYVALLLASVALQTTILLWIWVVPVIVGQLFLRPYLLAEHTGCDRTRSAFQNTRTTYTAIFVRWFAWNMPYHVEHHAYPSIPFHALPKLNRIVADQIVYRGRATSQ